VKARRLLQVESGKFRRPGDVVAFAMTHPGALSAHFLAAVYQRMTKGLLTESRQLRDVSCSTWASAHSGLQEMRDLREVQTLCLILDHINRNELERAMDALAQRIMAVQQAKKKDGKSQWEKAELIELLPPAGTSMVPAGMRALMS